MNIIKGKLHRAQRVVIYGQEGVGKTTLAAGFPRPLILDTEDGSHQLNVDRVPIGCLADLQAALDELHGLADKGECPYASIVIDTADHLWSMCARAICDENGWDSIESANFSKAYVRASERFVSLFGKLDCLVRLGLYIVVICHAKVNRVSPPDSPEYTKYCLKVNAPNAQAETAREFLKEWADALLFCRFKIAVDDKRKKALGENVARCICTSSAPQWESKNRHGLPEELPMDAAMLAPIFGGEAPNGTPRTIPAENGTPAPVEMEATRGAAAVPPSGSAPSELGFTPKGQDASAQAPAASAPTPEAAPAPSPASPARKEESFFFPEEEAVLIEFLVAKGRLQPGQTLADLSPNLKRALHERPQAAVKQAQDWKKGDQA